MKFALRPWKLSDISSLTRHANNKNVSQNLKDIFPYPYDETDAEGFIRFVSEHNPKGNMAIEINEEACGGIELQAQEDIYRMNMELGYWLSEEFWGNGIMTKVIKQMVEYGFENFDINRIYAISFHTNIASQKVLEKAGFSLEASLEGTILKDGKLLNEMVYGIRKSET